MRLQEKQKAPDFTVADLSDQEISLADYKGRQVLVSFYRYASCPFCNLRVAELMEKEAGWRALGLDLVAFFQSPAASILEHAGKQKPPFPILPDPNRDIYRLYGVESSLGGFLKAFASPDRLYEAVIKRKFKPGKMEGKKTLLPADFLIDAKGDIQIAYYGKDISDHLPVDAIEEAIKKKERKERK